MQYYGALGLEPRLALDPEDLKKRFYDRSRQWHPDRFSRASAEEQQRALDLTALLNDAFRTLRDPFARTEYFFKSAGIKLATEVSPGVLEEFFDLNMTLQEFKSGDESVRPLLVEARERCIKLQAESAEQLLSYLEQYDQRVSELEEPIGDLLNQRRYVANFLREVEKELGPTTPDTEPRAQQAV